MLHKANSSPLWFKEDGSSRDPMLQDSICMYICEYTFNSRPSTPSPQKYVTPYPAVNHLIAHIISFFFPTCPFVGPPFVRHQTISIYILFTFRYGELARTLGTPQPTAGPKRNDSTTIRRRQGIIF